MPYFYDSVTNILFIHIPKTGGTSIEKYFSSKYGISLNNKSIWGFIHHITWQTLMKYKDFFKINDLNLTSIAVVRNPYERIISDLFWWHKINKYSTPEDVFNELQSHVKINPDNHAIPQHTFVTDSSGELVPAIHILKMETLQSDMINLGYNDFNSKHNVNPIKGVNYYNYLNADSIQLINNFYHKDFELFNYNKIVENKIVEPCSMIYNNTLTDETHSLVKTSLVTSHISSSYPSAVSDAKRPEYFAMKFVYFYSEIYEYFNKHIRANLSSVFDLDAIKIDNLKNNRNHTFFGGVSIKIELVIQKIKENMGNTIIFTDATIFINSTNVNELVNFFNKYADSENDLCFADNDGMGYYNIGIILIKCNLDTLHFFECALIDLIKLSGWDQDIINKKLLSNNHKLKVAAFERPKIYCDWNFNPLYKNTFLIYKSFIHHDKNIIANFNKRLSIFKKWKLITNEEYDANWKHE